MLEEFEELTDEQLDLVTGGIESREYNFERKYEAELGEFVCDAYKPVEKNKDPNNLDLTRTNILNEKQNIDNNYAPFEYEGKIIK